MGFDWVCEIIGFGEMGVAEMSVAMKTGDFCEFEMRMKVAKISKRKKENKNGILRSLKRFFIDEIAIFVLGWRDQ